MTYVSFKIPIFFHISAELLPPKVRSISNSIIICFAFLCGFFISKTFVDLLEGIGEDNTFFLYGGICIVGTLLTALFVPETRGKSIDEIQRFFTKSRARPDESVPNCFGLKSAHNFFFTLKMTFLLHFYASIF